MVNKNNNKISGGVWAAVGITSLLFVCIISFGLYFFYNAPKTVIRERLDGGDIALTYTDDTCGLSLSNLIPIADSVGMSLNQADLYFDFSVAVNVDNARKIDYEIALSPELVSTINSKYVKVYLEKQVSGSYVQVMEPTYISVLKEKSKLGSPKGSMVLHTESKKKNTSDNYRLRFWVSDENPVTISNIDTFGVKVLVNGKAV